MTDEEIEKHAEAIGEEVCDIIAKHRAEGMPLDNALRSVLGGLIFMIVEAGAAKSQILKVVAQLVDAAEEDAMTRIECVTRPPRSEPSPPN